MTLKVFWLSLILISVPGCSFKSNKTSEIIEPPTFPKDFSDIPLKVEKSGLKELKSSKMFIKSIVTGRDDPFIYPSYQTVKLTIPESFKFLGLISTEGSLSAFVSFDEKNGTIKKGDIGGETTKLIPNGWVVSSLNREKQLLQLNFKNSNATIKLMPDKKYDIKKLR